MRFFNNIYSIIKISHNQILLVIVSTITLFVVFGVWKPDFLKNFPLIWENWLEASITFMLLIVAVFIWYNEKKQDWEMALPKKLNVCYKLDDKYNINVINAPLASEQDIRPWGLSIAQTMLNKTLRIEFEGFEIARPEIKTDTEGRNFKLYSITFFLTEKIGGLDESIKEIKFDNTGRYVNDRKSSNNENYSSE